MKAVRVTADQDRTLNIAPLPLPVVHRTGEASAERYRQQSKGRCVAVVGGRPNIGEMMAKAMSVIAEKTGR